MRVRRAGPDEEPVLHAVFLASVRGLAAAHDGPEHIAAWQGGRRPEERRASMRSGTEIFWVAEQDGDVVGFASLARDELDLLYVRPDAAGRGAGSALLGMVEGDARARGLATLRLLASTNAEAFFAARGYSVARRETVEMRPGIRLARARMRKAL